MLNVVLCGGNSSRMGSDKGTLILYEKTWAQCAFEKLLAVSAEPVVVSINATQLKSYQSFFPLSQLIIDNEQMDLKGPLLGLLSVHQQFPHKDLFVLACDLIKMKKEVLHELTLQHKAGNYEATVFKNDNEIEPLCGIYTATGLSKIKSDFYAGKLSKQSMRNALQFLNTHYLPLKEEWKSSFQNFNSQNDLSEFDQADNI